MAGKLFTGNILILAFVLGLFACAKKEADKVKIGAVLPLTGDLATYGENAKNGIILLSEEINAQGGINGKRLQIIFEDSKGHPKQAVSAIQKLINADKVLAIIGDVASSSTLAIAPIANRKKIVVVSPAASSPDITDAGPYIYRVWPSDVFEASRMANYVNKNDLKTVAILYVNNDYGRAMVQEFKKHLGGTGPTIAAEENFEQNTTDVKAQLARIKALNPDSMYLISYPKDSVIILRQYKEMGLKSRILSTSSFEDPLIIRDVGEIAEGAVFTSPVPPEETDPVVRQFRTEYEKRFGHEPGLVSDYGYDALKVIVEALKVSGETSRKGISEGIEKVRNVNGATGLISFDTNGDVIKPAGIKTVKGKRFIWLKQ